MLWSISGEKLSQEDGEQLPSKNFDLRYMMISDDESDLGYQCWISYLPFMQYWALFIQPCQLIYILY